jgi:hypothetical protein
MPARGTAGLRSIRHDSNRSVKMDNPRVDPKLNEGHRKWQEKGSIWLGERKSKCRSVHGSNPLD